jgi:cell division transport system ATP-binding protein
LADNQAGGRKLLELSQVTKVYPGGTVALRDVDLSVEQGEFVYLIGPSGAGKSTLLRLLYRGDRPTRGTVRVNGVDVGRLSATQIPAYRRQLGVVFQDFRLLPQWTVFENVAFALRVCGASRAEIQRRVPEVLRQVGLMAKKDVRVSLLSGGEQQRTALARALVHRPRLLLADEPTGNLDPASSREVHRLLLEVSHQGTTVLMATHAQRLVDSVRRRVVALEGGQVVRDAVAGGYAHG